MDPSLFSPRAPGELVRTSRDAWAFLPAPLPDAVPISAAAACLLAQASTAIGRLNQAAIQHVRPEQLIPGLSKREAVHSSRIEGARTTLEEAFVGLDPAAGPDAREMLNYEHALGEGVHAIQSGRPFRLFLVGELHVRLFTGGRGAGEKLGVFRDDQVFLGAGAGADIAQARFVPPPALAVASAMESLQRWIEVPPAHLPALIKIALTHYQFETIHPFRDGNGRVGRLLIALQLLAEDVVQAPLLYVSPFLEARREEYFDRLLRVSVSGDFDGWIEFFLEAVATAATETLDRIVAIEALLASLTRAVASSTRSHYPLQVLDGLRESPFVTVPEVRQRLGCSAQSARNAVQLLVREGVLEPLRASRKTERPGKNPDVYVCPALWAIVDQ